MVRYIFKPWVPSYAFWIGIVHMIGLNLAGVLWLVWSKRMELDAHYQPKWMFRIHWFMTCFGILFFTLAACWAITAPEKTVTIKVWGMSVGQPHVWVAVPLSLIFTVFHGIGIYGIRREQDSSPPQ
jgi:hypothetical protein